MDKEIQAHKAKIRSLAAQLLDACREASLCVLRATAPLNEDDDHILVRHYTAPATWLEHAEGQLQQIHRERKAKAEQDADRRLFGTIQDEKLHEFMQALRGLTDEEMVRLGDEIDKRFPLDREVTDDEWQRMIEDDAALPRPSLEEAYLEDDE